MTPIQPNGTDAKDIAFHFLSMTGVERATPQVIAKTIAQAKRLLNAGYNKKEICSAIDKAVQKGISMYSIGYITTSIKDLLKEVETDEMREKGQEIKVKMEEQYAEERKAVSDDDESAERNRKKADGFGVQSRLGKKFNFDMFEK